VGRQERDGAHENENCCVHREFACVFISRAWEASAPVGAAMCTWLEEMLLTMKPIRLRATTHKPAEKRTLTFKQASTLLPIAQP